jgi:3-oxoacyl-[acyl-carrier protein] reductase/2-[hydroxy(phenyl)methyl]-succinyl-CoA dehydrogenase BbsD subunit
MRLKGKVALITGAGSGMGRAMALLFAREGADVIINDIEEEGGKDTEKQIKELGYKALYVSGDISDKSQVGTFVQKGIEEFGTIDILVNNAGIIIDAPITDMKESVWDKHIDVNLKGFFLVSQAVVPQMIKKRYGKILCISSRCFLGDVDRIAYVASKGGVVSFTRGLALELVGNGITVNCIAPGAIKTPILKNIDKKRIEALEKIQPMGRMGEPEEIANAALFLVSDEASFVTGQTLLVDGGRSLGTGIFA